MCSWLHWTAAHFMFFNWYRISHISDILGLTSTPFRNLQDINRLWSVPMSWLIASARPGDTNGISVNCDCRSILRYWTTLVYQKQVPSNQQKAFPDSNNRIQFVFGCILIADVAPIWTWELWRCIFRRRTVSPRSHNLIHVPGKERAR